MFVMSDACYHRIPNPHRCPIQFCLQLGLFVRFFSLERYYDTPQPRSLLHPDATRRTTVKKWMRTTRTTTTPHRRVGDPSSESPALATASTTPRLPSGDNSTTVGKKTGPSKTIRSARTSDRKTQCACTIYPTPSETAPTSRRGASSRRVELRAFQTPPLFFES